jgi:branched-chain amino acid transport system permease protein
MGYFLTNASRVFETALSAIGGHLTLGLGGIIFLGFPAAFWCGAYGYAIAAKAGLSVGPSVGIGLLLAGAAGAVFAFFYARLSNDSFAVLTLASLLALEALIRSWDSLTGGVLGIAGVPRLGGMTVVQLVALQAVVACVAFLLESLLIRSRFGRSLRALKENKDSLVALGTSPERTGQCVVFIFSMLAGVGGIFGASRIQFLDLSLGGIVFLVQILTIAIIANTPGTLRVLGVTIVVILLPEIFRFFSLPVLILGYLRNLLYAAILIILVYYVVHHTSLKRNV